MLNFNSYSIRMSYQLQYKDCITLEILLKIWWKANAIAKEIWVNKSSIFREIKKHAINWVYNWTIAWTKRQLFRILVNQNRPRIIKWSDIEKYILEKTKIYWSPEQIAWRWKKDRWEAISKDTIYNFIYRKYPWLIKKYFRRKWVKYTDQWQKRSMIEDARSIDKRPNEVNERKEIWNWEWDSVEDWTHKARVITEVERKTWYLLASISPVGKPAKVSEVIYNIFKEIPKEKKKTMTLDNGMEFRDHKVIECTTKMKIYFCHSHAPWEKWSNENTNGLLRQFIPKKTPILSVKNEELEKYVLFINNRPRKRLWYNTPQEEFYN
jgi:IS30 family transposase